MEMKIEITCQPIFWLDLTVEQVKFMMAQSQRHYDSVCINASLPGGFMVGWFSHASWMESNTDNDGEPCYMRATWHELDIASKCIETTPLMSPSEVSFALQLSAIFRRIMNCANEQFTKQIKGTASQQGFQFTTH